MEVAHAEMRLELLCETVRFSAEKTLFYSNLKSVKIRSLSDLESIPLISKIDISKSGASMLTCRPDVGSINISSGTTWGDYLDASTLGGELKLKNLAEPAFVYRSPEEDDLCRQLTISNLSAGLTLRIDNGTHGARHYKHAKEISFPLQKPFHYAAIKKIIRDSPKIFGESITGVCGPSNQLKNLAAMQDLAKEKIFSPFGGPDYLIGYGSFVTSKWRKLLGETYLTELTDAYAISEILGSGSPQCNICKAYHVQPWVIPEIINPLTGLRALSDSGELVLTCLLPFSRVQPIIRYRTGDIVRVRKCAIDFSFLPCGKTGDSVFSKDGQLVIGGYELLERLDSIEQINKWHTPNQKMLGIPSSYGPPKIQVMRELTSAKKSHNDQAKPGIRIELSKNHKNDKSLRDLIKGIINSDGHSEEIFVDFGEIDESTVRMPKQ
ncbi:hypothetical protein SAMN05216189_102915 [Pseudomonas delhiensis]|uniref:Uncharacterized protein n=1 Tax=Pseudomonas delhiensis TaxID=366289 RepID=A0A239IUV6_9PSED|nr:hypothetical protein [Pseudomonas delhiensis]SDK11361.1 hypothetical protein SAMN05216189_102915 [Pseudomonas delhiensis]SNS97556.1 hypothetical protein SAMN06295949_11116 [Pseudomonas delhiensis]